MKYPSITASIDSAFLSKVDRVFDASPTTVFNELLQNARRAGATDVRVSIGLPNELGSLTVTFADNGHGVSDPAVLLRLAAGGWDADTRAAEDPAGMGFFCLSNFPHVDIRSNDWHAYLTPEMFRGEAPMQPLVHGTIYDGTVITMEWPDVDVYHIQNGLRDAARYCEIESVSLKVGLHPVEMINVVKFLHDAEFVREFPEHGYTIGAVGGYSHRQMNALLNFHGVCISVDLDDDLFDSVKDLGYNLRVDIVNTADLQLVLPARNALKHNAARDTMLEHCKLVMLGLIEKQYRGEHRMAFVHYEEAVKLGFDVGEAEIYLKRYCCNDVDYSDKERFLKTSIVVNSEMRSNLVRELWNRGLNTTPELAVFGLVASEPKYVGYSWYDGLTTLDALEVGIDGKFYTEEEFYMIDVPYHKGLFMWVDNIVALFKLSSGRLLTSPVILLPNVQSGSSCFESAFDYDDNKIFVTRSIKDVDDWLTHAVDIIGELGFSASDYWEADSEETQREEFDQEATAALLDFVASPEDSIRFLIDSHMKKLPWDALHASWTITHDGNRRHDPVVTIIDAAPAEDETAQ
jgi:hypothetical protein